MRKEKSAGAIIFRKRGERIFYLLLHYPGASHRAKKDYWDFPKGHIEKGEKERDTVKREVLEETGLKKIKFVEGFKEKIKYFFRFQGETILKTVVFYLCQSQKEKVKISTEHVGFQWFSFEQALEKLSFENSKEILRKANNFLAKKFDLTYFDSKSKMI
jgi:bis(5'-nucleosidyl)-tetraphosphatase